MDLEMDFVDSSSEDEELPAPRAPAAANPHRLPLQQFLRLIAGGRMMDHGHAASNDELVASLRASGALTSDPVAAALRLCARDLFVVDHYRDEAFADAPIRVEEMGFNISAPHMHATCLEALDLRPGASVLDVGVGCGVVAAAAAVIVGRGGRVVGIDVRRECVALSRDNIARLAAGCPQYAAAAAECSIEHGNAFITQGTPHRGAYDRVHVGASCPPSALPPLLRLLKPRGGTMVVPVAPSDLRVITVKPTGAVTQRVVSQVRFSELEVPTDAEVVLATLRLERRARTAPPQARSTFGADVAAIAEGAKWQRGGAPSTSPAGVINGMPPSPTASASGSTSAASGSGSASGSSSAAPMLTPELLGEPDCVLAGDGWEAAVHSAVLRQRCDHLRARADSGMRDASLGPRLEVPPHFSRPAVAALVAYLYTNACDACDACDGDGGEGEGVQAVVDLLHVAQYYGVPALAARCEAALARALRAARRADKANQCTAEAAAQMLGLAHDCGLPHLRAVALDYVIAHHPAVAATDAYAALPRDAVAAVAAEACALHARTRAHLHELRAAAAGGQELPDP